MTTRLLLLAACLLTPLRADQPAPAAAPAPATEFIRVEKVEGATALQTAVTHFAKDGVTVDLVGAIHIADRKYYQALNQLFEGYDALLYEGIGGEKRGEAVPADAPEPQLKDPSPEEIEREAESKVALDEQAGKEREQAAEDQPAEGPARKGKGLGGLHTVYEKGADWLGLSYQMKEIDYRKANFVHADLSAEEFFALQSERGESVVGFALKAGFRQPEEGKKVHEPNSYKLLASLVTGNKNGIKRELVQTLGQGDDQVAGLAGDSVIIGERNEKCLQVLDREIQAGRKKLGIFYGAAHFPDMEKRLLERGWTKTGSEWMTAWDIGE